MTVSNDVESTGLLERVVLLGVLELAERGSTPAHAGEVRQVCMGALGAVDGDVVGTPSEAEVTRALNELEGKSLLTSTREDESPSGKGRPKYGLAADREAVLGELSDDEAVSALVERVRA